MRPKLLVKLSDLPKRFCPHDGNQLKFKRSTELDDIVIAYCSCNFEEQLPVPIEPEIMKIPTLREQFMAMIEIAPELKDVLEEGIKLRDEVVAKCVARDLAFSQMEEAELKAVYEDFFFNIVTDEMVAEMALLPPVQLLNSAGTLARALQDGLIIE